MADDDERAAGIAAPYGQWVLDIRSGRGAQPYVTPAQARARQWTAEERVAVADRVDTQFVGSPETVAERLRVLARVTRADELLVTTICTEHRDRMHSYELLAKEWGLPAHGSGRSRRPPRGGRCRAWRQWRSPARALQIHPNTLA